MNRLDKPSRPTTLIQTILLCIILFSQPADVAASFSTNLFFFPTLFEGSAEFQLQVSKNTSKDKNQFPGILQNTETSHDSQTGTGQNGVLFSKTSLKQNGIAAVLIIFLISLILVWQVRLKREIKQRKILDQKLRETQGLLNKRISERTCELEKANKALQEEMEEKLELARQFALNQKMKTIGLMAGGIAHKLNNILTSIISYPDLILMKLPENDALSPLVKEIKASGRRAEEVMADLLNLTGGTVLNKTPVDLNNLIIDYINSPEHKNVTKLYQEISFRTELASNLPQISCSIDQIKKCFLNLVTHAAEAIDGDGEILISTRILDGPKARLQNLSVDENNYVVMSIQDSGPEIEIQHLEHIFEPFYFKKVMGKRTSNGLDLPIVWNIVHDHEYKMDVSSGKNGTLFNIYIPSSKEKTTDLTEKLPLEELIGNKEKILVVEDDQAQQKVICELLKKLNYQPFAVDSGEQSIVFLCDNSVDLVLIEMHMEPGLNGRETYEQIIEIHPEQTAIVISGYNPNNDVKEMMKLGAELYLKKPFTLDELGAAVKESLTDNS